MSQLPQILARADDVSVTPWTNSLSGEDGEWQWTVTAVSNLRAGRHRQEELAYVEEFSVVLRAKLDLHIGV